MLILDIKCQSRHKLTQNESKVPEFGNLCLLKIKLHRTLRISVCCCLIRTCSTIWILSLDKKDILNVWTTNDWLIRLYFSLHLTLRLFYFSLRFQVERNMSINTVQFENQAKEAKPSMDAMLLYSKIDEENQLEMLSSLGHWWNFINVFLWLLIMTL